MRTVRKFNFKLRLQPAGRLWKFHRGSVWGIDISASRPNRGGRRRVGFPEKLLEILNTKQSYLDLWWKKILIVNLSKITRPATAIDLHANPGSCIWNAEWAIFETKNKLVSYQKIIDFFG